MNKQVLLSKTAVQRIVSATGALLVVQWAYVEETRFSWDPLNKKVIERYRMCRYHLVLVVANEDPRSSGEYRLAVERLQKKGEQFYIQTYRLKEALRAIKTADKHFYLVYRVSKVLYNAAPDHFRGRKALTVAKTK